MAFPNKLWRVKLVNHSKQHISFIMSPRGPPYPPILRNRDWVLAHSWLFPMDYERTALHKDDQRYFEDHDIIEAKILVSFGSLSDSINLQETCVLNWLFRTHSLKLEVDEGGELSSVHWAWTKNGFLYSSKQMDTWMNWIRIKLRGILGMFRYVTIQFEEGL